MILLNVYLRFHKLLAVDVRFYSLALAALASTNLPFGLVRLSSTRAWHCAVSFSTIPFIRCDFIATH